MRFALGALIDKKEAAAKPRPTARGRDTGPIGGPIERVGAWRRCCVLKFSERLFLRRSFFPANSSAEIPAIIHGWMPVNLNGHLPGVLFPLHSCSAGLHRLVST